MTGKKDDAVVIALDRVDEALLETLAKTHGRTLEEEAAAQLEAALEKAAKDFAENIGLRRKQKQH